MKEIDFKDRVPTYPGRIMLAPVDGKENTYDMTRADEPTEEGTPLNRRNFMAMQGFIGSNTVFNNDGSITETNDDGHTLTTTFNNDGGVVETFVGEKTIIKTTSFVGNEIREAIS